MAERKGKCPKCDQLISSVTVSAVHLNSWLNTRRYDGVIYTCPHCSVILGAGTDPVALAHDAVDEIVRRLRKARTERPAASIAPK